MGISVMVLGESGTGKSASMRDMSPAETLLIQAIKKPLPFRSSEWKQLPKDGGNIFVSDNSSNIIAAMQKTKRKIIIIDDFQYIMANEFMRRSDERGFDKFTEIGRHAWDILTSANQLADDVRVYILAHTQSDDFGRVRAKTIGKMLDDKISIEGMLTIVLRTSVDGGNYQFRTRNNGSDTVKTPMGMFESEMIENNLKAIDDEICKYYGVNQDGA